MFKPDEFNTRYLEKIYRMSDILQRIYSIEYTKKRLSLYGGTALNFLHIKHIPRLSMDLDFNYRTHQQGRWEQERNEIDTIIKKILHDLRYQQREIKIQPSYPLTRFTAEYKTEDGSQDSLKIEIGYLRRIPILPLDTTLPFTHPKTGDEFLIQTPQSEELFGNKFCTLLYRYGEEHAVSSRDLFDVYVISKTKFTASLFEIVMVIDSLMRKEPRLYTHDTNKIMKNFFIDDQLKNLVRSRNIPMDIVEKTHAFITKQINISKKNYKTMIDAFFDGRRFEPSLLPHHTLLNPQITHHPSILWNLKQLAENKKH